MYWGNFLELWFSSSQIPHTLWYVNPSLTFIFFNLLQTPFGFIESMFLCSCVCVCVCVCERERERERERKIMEVVWGSCSLMGFVGFRIIQNQFFLFLFLFIFYLFLFMFF
jgi:hypothetical protein